MTVYNTNLKHSTSQEANNNMEKVESPSPYKDYDIHSSDSKDGCKSNEGKLKSIADSTSTKKYLPLEEAYRWTFVFASIMGLHIIRRRQDGSHTLSIWKVVVMVIWACLSVLSVPVAVIPIFQVVPFWFKVLMLPYMYGGFFCLYAYIQTVRHTKDMIGFMDAVSELEVQVTYRIWVLLIWGFIYPVLITSCSTAMFLGLQQIVYAPAITVVTFTPAVLDVYMGFIVAGLYHCLETLRRCVDKTDAWTLEAAQKVSDRWIYLEACLKTINKMFNTRIHLRLVGLVVQAMSLIFVFWSMSEKTAEDCLPMLVVTWLPLVEVLSRFQNLCYLGEQIMVSGETLLGSVRRAGYEAGLGTPAHQILTVLTARLEVTPPTIHVWGMDSLSAQTFVSLSGVMVTYVVVLLQFCKRSYSPHSNDPDNKHRYTAYDHCFMCNDTSPEAELDSWKSLTWEPI